MDMTVCGEEGRKGGGEEGRRRGREEGRKGGREEREEGRKVEHKKTCLPFLGLTGTTCVAFKTNQ